MSAELEQKTRKTDSDKWEVTANRFVAFIDIMGFKDLVARNSHETVYNKLQSIAEHRQDIDTALKEDNVKNLFNKKEIFTTMFSDSICIFSQDDSIDSFDLFSATTVILFSQSMKKQIPMKGAIAYGKISINREQQIFFGQPIIDAFLLQEDVNYYGIILHNTVDKYMKEKKNEATEGYFFEAKTNLKSGIISHKNLDWFSEYLEIKDHEETLEELFENLKNDVSGSPRRYIDNTIEMMNLAKSKKSGDINV